MGVKKKRVGVDADKLAGLVHKSRYSIFSENEKRQFEANKGKVLSIGVSISEEGLRQILQRMEELGEEEAEVLPVSLTAPIK